MITRSSLARRGQGLFGCALTAAVLLATPATASADVTAFFGAAHPPKIRRATGIAVGIGVVGIGIEFEVADIAEKTSGDAPRLRTGTVNAIVHSPTSCAQVYATAGAGVYRESLTGGPREINTSVNIGAGLKMDLLGPLRLRVDYRLYRLRGDALHPTVHRVYAGLNTSF